MSSVATPDRDAGVVPVARTRLKLVVSAGSTVLAAVAGLPGRIVVALAVISLAIPLAVAVAGGGRVARELLFPVRRPTRDSGLGHSPEQGERFVT
ncbi:hypothetical protein GA0070607_5624 [Micromonospora coriariae]|uniref:Uncharacterized protein n=1 Tax=Micromonospora coriariae TaxID=285665 RepID=A0A1C4XQM1_9ACTN|nr:hypothetical protein [Micromonospora coriariae]SCF10809.1 hypothetical protein GA0070607_5624 [Micromonospora coriariae]